MWTKLREQDSVRVWKKLENAADRASELPANIPQPKRIGAWHPHPSSARFVGQFFGKPDTFVNKKLFVLL
jgi:hypothetical protein